MIVSIIGTSGRKDADKLTRASFNWMIARAIQYIKDLAPRDVPREKLHTWAHANIDLVSGGSAWADHVVVHLWQRLWCRTLTLHLPCSAQVIPSTTVDITHSTQTVLDSGDNASTHFEFEFHGTNDPSRRVFTRSAASTLMQLHIDFQRKTGVCSLRELLAVHIQSLEPTDALASAHQRLEQSTGPTAHPPVWVEHVGFYARNTAVARCQFLLCFGTGKRPTGGSLNTWNKCMGTKTYIPLPKTVLTS